MLRSLFSAISGLRSHQVRLDVVGNNIANVNTVGFKTGRALFSDMISQTVKEAAGPQGNVGGSNPAQVGLGVQVAGIEQILTQGSLLSTNNPNDRAIEGDGFFILAGPNGDFTYTRDGAFSYDSRGYLVNTLNQQAVQGWLADNSGGILNTGRPTSIVIPPISQSMPAVATSSIKFSGNLNSADAVGTVRDTGIEVYDSLGNKHTVTVTFTKTAAGTWDWSASTAEVGGTVTDNGTRTLTFDGSGLLTGTGNGYFTLGLSNGAVPSQAIAPDFGTAGNPGAITQYASQTTVAPLSQDGNASGTLQSLVTDSAGVISGMYSNGLQRPLAQIAIATFPNPQGLVKAGENSFSRSSNSGDPLIRPAGNGRGLIRSGVLEGSNVDLAQQFTDMIVAQRGFQANSRLITASDEILQDLVNLKR